LEPRPDEAALSDAILLTSFVTQGFLRGQAILLTFLSAESSLRGRAADIFEKEDSLRDYSADIFINAKLSERPTC
jgi:hypothetical protein